MASDVEWDPTGRYVTTSVSWWGHKVSLCYVMIFVIICDELPIQVQRTESFVAYGQSLKQQFA